MSKIAKIHFSRIAAMNLTFFEVVILTYFSQLTLDNVLFAVSLLFANLFIATMWFKDELFTNLYKNETNEINTKKHSSFTYKMHKIYIRIALIIDAFCAPLFFVLWIIHEP